MSRDFVGVTASQWYNNVKPATTLRDSIVADAGVYNASVALADDVAVGSFTVQAESIFSQLIPSSQTETPLLDLNAVSENPALIAWQHWSALKLSLNESGAITIFIINPFSSCYLMRSHGMRFSISTASKIPTNKPLLSNGRIVSGRSCK